MSEIKIVFTGTVGSGKTEAIRTLSEIDIISTDVKASDEVSNLKETTTIAMDYGERNLPSGETLALYGTPGQKRFSYMWRILTEGAWHRDHGGRQPSRSHRRPLHVHGEFQGIH